MTGTVSGQGLAKQELKRIYIPAEISVVLWKVHTHTQSSCDEPESVLCHFVCCTLLPSGKAEPS